MTRPTDKAAVAMLTALVAERGWDKRYQDDDGDVVRQVYPTSMLSRAWVRIASRSGGWQATAHRKPSGKVGSAWVRGL